MGQAMRSGRALRALVVPAMACMMLSTATVASASGAASGPWVGVRGNRLIDATGAPVQLAGVNRSGTEYACAQGWGVFDGPVDDAAVAVMRTWDVDAVRLPLNEHCWLARNGVDPSLSGRRYRDAVRGFVQRLHAAGLVVVLELHWSAAGDRLALGQSPMPNTDHSVDFWRSVAQEYRDTPGIIFELFNEPHGVSWTCWRDGCLMPGGWRAAGMQELLDAVRGTGARQPVVATGLEWGNDLSGWLDHRPHDPAGGLVAGFHAYQFNRCLERACWEATVGRLATHVPVVATEVGQDDCGSAFVVDFMRWADDTAVSYLAWTWNDWEGCGGPALLESYDGIPSSYGAGVRAHLRSRAPTGPGSPSVYRLSGPGRVETAAAVSAATFAPGVEVAFVARQDVHADALAAGPVAAAAGGPVLLVSRATVPAATRQELLRLRPRRIVALGGRAAVTDGVLTELATLAPDGARRVGGSDRYDTAVLLSRVLGAERPDALFVASGDTFPDALAGGAAAAAVGAPLLLVPGDAAPEGVLEEARRLRPARVLVIGGRAVVSDRVVAQLRARLDAQVDRLAGAERYDTAARIARTVGTRGGTVFVATGTQFPDALAGVPAAAASGAPILLVPPHGDPPPAVEAALSDLLPGRLVVLGGEQAVSATVAQRLRALLSP